MNSYWTIIKDNNFEPYVFKTKRSMLVSYDMMPLRGLAETERVLISKGMTPARVKVVKDKGGIYWAFARNGVLDLRWESLSASEEEAFSQAAQREELPWFVWSKTANICLKRTEKLRAKSIAELKRRGIEAVKVNLIPVKVAVNE